MNVVAQLGTLAGDVCSYDRSVHQVVTQVEPPEIA